MNVTETLQRQVIDLLQDFDARIDTDLRSQVLALVPVWDAMSKLGGSLLPRNVRRAARKRLLYYFQRYPDTVLSQHELAIVSGISEWARRVRELRVEFGWAILSGKTVLEMLDEGDIDGDREDLKEMVPSDYILMSEEQDKEAAYRWRVAKEIRNNDTSVKARILKFLRLNVGSPVSGEELRYVAKDRTEWARRVRELRTEDGWPVSTCWNGRPELASGMYVLEEDRQLPVHDRRIPDAVRRQVLVRDNYICQECGWTREQWTPDDPRHLELHHVEHHARGGENTPENLVTLCNICHDVRHV